MKSIRSAQNEASNRLYLNGWSSQVRRLILRNTIEAKAGDARTPDKSAHKFVVSS